MSVAGLGCTALFKANQPGYLTGADERTCGSVDNGKGVSRGGTPPGRDIQNARALVRSLTGGADEGLCLASLSPKGSQRSLAVDDLYAPASSRGAREREREGERDSFTERWKEYVQRDRNIGTEMPGCEEPVGRLGDFIVGTKRETQAQAQTRTQTQTQTQTGVVGTKREEMYHSRLFKQGLREVTSARQRRERLRCLYQTFELFQDPAIIRCLVRGAYAIVLGEGGRGGREGGREGGIETNKDAVTEIPAVLDVRPCGCALRKFDISSNTL